MAADLVFDTSRFIGLLRKLIGVSRFLQNNPPDHIPMEDKAGEHVLAALEPFKVENGGPLHVQHVSFVEGRGNIMVTYRGTGDGILSFVGAHMDVVPANPETWGFDPFTLLVDGDKLCGRGTTDCLGHVALLTELFVELGSKRPKLARTVVGVFIANEENSKVPGVGVDEMVARGMLTHLLPGPLFWLDTADTNPCIGTGGMAAWKLRASGKLFHSGLPHKAINALELAMEAVAAIQSRFYNDFPAHVKEKEYKFATSSTLKPTQMTLPSGSINQIPGECEVCGDMRLTPFYDVPSAMAKVKAYVEELNKDLSSLPTRGPWSTYALPDEKLTGTLELTWFESHMSGVACKLDSPGYRVLCEATLEATGRCEPYSITGSLPCIKELQDAGFDVQTCGYGLMSTYHANNEYALLSNFEQGFNVLRGIITRLNT